MKRKSVFLHALLFSTVSVLITIAQYYANVLVLSLGSRDYYFVSPTELLFYEGVLLVIVGLITLIGTTAAAGVEEATKIVVIAKAIFKNNKIVNLSKIFRDYVWKQQGLISLGLILIIAGMLMILIYLLPL